MTKIAETPICIAEELILLMLNEQSGYLEMVPGWNFSCVMAGTIIADLALMGRIDADLESLYVIDPTPTGDDLLDPTLKEIAEAEETSDTQFWIERNTSRCDEIISGTLDRLVNRGILDYESGDFWRLSRGVSRSGSYPTSDNTIRHEAKARILDIILNDTVPDPRDAILVALMHSWNGFKLLLAPEELDEKVERIETIAKLDLIGRSVASAVSESSIRPKSRPSLLTKPIPQLRIVDILRQRDFLKGNIPKAMHEIFRKHGPVVRVPFKMAEAPLSRADGGGSKPVGQQVRPVLRTLQGLHPRSRRRVRGISKPPWHGWR